MSAEVLTRGPVPAGSSTRGAGVSRVMSRRAVMCVLLVLGVLAQLLAMSLLHAAPSAHASQAHPVATAAAAGPNAEPASAPMGTGSHPHLHVNIADHASADASGLPDRSGEASDEADAGPADSGHHHEAHQHADAEPAPAAGSGSPLRVPRELVPVSDSGRPVGPPVLDRSARPD